MTEVWHADDCGAGCDGCGYINDKGCWIAGPTPVDDLPFQLARATGE